MQTQEDELKNALKEGLNAQVKPEEEPEEAAQVNAEPQAAAPANDEADQPLTIAEMQSENLALREQLMRLEEDKKADHEQMVRAVAEAMNMKKRAEQDVERERKYGNEKLLKALLPIVDSLDLAIEHTDKQNPVLKPTLEGIENTMSLFLKELKNFGVEQVNPQGAPFDPNLHQAISMVPSNEVAQNHVLNVMQKGYVLQGRVIRPAMVIVSSGPQTQAAGTTDEHKTINIEA
ncbi:MAG: nucleotide exchange factor GrpE [Succinivibrio sp.]|nr:nucleotide exchange factor GrpE [Succinivibrio sp.]